MHETEFEQAQGQGLAVEREALRRLPDLLGELLDEPVVVASASYSESGADGGADLRLADRRGRRWVIEVKSWTRPVRMAEMARQLLHHVRDEEIPLLVVPYMTPASGRAAEEAGVNWIDLAGNAHIRRGDLFVSVQGRPNRKRSPGRRASPFAPKSARITRALLLDVSRWWRQRDLVEATGLNDGNVSRIVRRLDEELLLERDGNELRPRDPRAMIDAWAQDYRFDRHQIHRAHLSGGGIELTRTLSYALERRGVHHAFTGLPAAWAIDHFAQFRLNSVYVDGDPHEISERLELRTIERGANVQLIAPDDAGVFFGEKSRDGLNCVAPVQVYLDLLHLPERAGEAADQLRREYLRADLAS